MLASRLDLSIGFFACFVGQLGFGQSLAQVAQGSFGLVRVAQLLANGLQLLAQVELVLGLVHRLADLRLDLRADLEHFQLARDQLGHFARAHERVEFFEHVLALGGLDVDIGGHEVGQPARVVDVGRGDAHLVRQRRRKLDHSLEQRLEIFDQPFDFEPQRLAVRFAFAFA